ncbi:hypothetical protein ACY2DA_02425 [Staphylococcus simulans]
MSAQQNINNDKHFYSDIISRIERLEGAFTLSKDDEGRYNLLNERINAVKTTLDEFKYETKENFAAIDKKFDKMDDKFDKMDEKFDKMDGKIKKEIDGLKHDIKWMMGICITVITLITTLQHFFG